MYSVYEYGSMIADRARSATYLEALRETVRSDSVVLDLGTGTGYFAMAAYQLGARKVYAVDVNPAVKIGEEIGRKNNCNGKVKWICSRVEDVELPEKVDIVICDLRGATPMYAGNLETIQDVRERLLKPDGIFIPRCDRMYVAAVEAPERYEKHVAAWTEHAMGFDMSPALGMAVNTLGRLKLGSDHVVTNRHQWGEVDYLRTMPGTFSSNFELAATRSATVHGLVLWYEADLTPTVGYSTGPGSETTTYLLLFLPMQKPFHVRAGERIPASVAAVPTASEYIFNWSAGGGPMQSTLLSSPLPEGLQRTAEDFKPVRNLDAEIDAYVVSLMDGNTELAEIAKRLLDRFPGEKMDYRYALARAGELSRRYSH